MRTAGPTIPRRMGTEVQGGVLSRCVELLISGQTRGSQAGQPSLAPAHSVVSVVHNQAVKIPLQAQIGHTDAQ